MIRKQNRKGSITVFLVLTLTASFSVIFGLLEAGRVSALHANAEMSTAQVRDGILASYQRSLWEQYHLMFWEAEEKDFPELESLKSLQQSMIDGNRIAVTEKKNNFYLLPLSLAEADVASYQLATDRGGEAFRAEAAGMMKYVLAEESVETLKDWLEQSRGESSEESFSLLDQKAQEALDGMRRRPETEDTQETENVSAAMPPANYVEVQENPLDWYVRTRQKDLLSLLMGSEVSEKTMDLTDAASHRSLQKGNLQDDYGFRAADKVLFVVYLCSFFQNASDGGNSSGHPLDYELEYIIGGKTSDRANLRAAVRRIVLLREAANLLYLEKNPQKQSEISAVAASLAFLAAQPQLEPLIRQGLLAAWAYAESLSDVRILLGGGKVSPVKADAQWHTDLKNLSGTFGRTRPGEQKEGLSYSNYLLLVLWAINSDTLSLRAIDLIEKNLNLQMDHMVSQVNCTYRYEASPLFWNFVTLGDHSPGTYQFRNQETICFIPE